MLIPLLRKYLRAYRGPLTAVVIFQLIGTIASLYLPALNAEIIDDGVAKGDTGFIISTGMRHAGHHGAADRLHDHRRLLRRPHRHGVRPGRPRGAVPPGRQLLRPGDGEVRRADADHPQHQRRAAGADAGADDLHAAGGGADHVHRRHLHGAARRTSGWPGCCWSACRCW